MSGQKAPEIYKVCQKDSSDAKAIITNQDLVASELLYAFRLNRAIGVSDSTMKKETRFYLKPVFAIRADGTEAIEQHADSKPCVKFKDGKAWFSFKWQRGGYAKISLDKLKDNNSMAISKVLSLIKRSTCKDDQALLKRSHPNSEGKADGREN